MDVNHVHHMNITWNLKASMIPSLCNTHCVLVNCCILYCSFRIGSTDGRQLHVPSVRRHGRLGSGFARPAKGLL